MSERERRVGRPDALPRAGARSAGRSPSVSMGTTGVAFACCAMRPSPRVPTYLARPALGFHAPAPLARPAGEA